MSDARVRHMPDQEAARVRCNSDEREVEMEESYEDMVLRERFEKLRRLMKQDYRDTFKARCMAMADLCKEMVSHLELGDDWCESWEAFHALTECAKTFVETDIPIFEAHRDEERERKRGKH